MDNKTHKARMQKKINANNRLDVEGLTNKLSVVLTDLTDRYIQLNKDVDIGDLSKLSYAISNMSNTYFKALEVGELEARLSELENNNVDKN